MKSLDIGLTDHQIYELMRSVDSDSDAHIDFVEFASRFGPALELISTAKAATAMSANKPKPQSPRMPNSPLTPRSGRKPIEWEELDIDVLERLRTLSRTMYRIEGSGGLPAAFGFFDVDSVGFFGYENFKEVVRDRYEMPFLSDTEALSLFEAVDSNNSGRVNYLEFLNAFQITDSRIAPGGDDWRTGVVQQVANVLYQLRVHVRAAFRNFFDVDNDGRISAEDFQSGMVAFNDTMDSPLTLMQIEELRRALDKNGDGYISYREFFDGLAIIDDKPFVTNSLGEEYVTGKPAPLMRKSSSFYVQQLEREERLGKLVASKKAAEARKSGLSFTSPSSSSDDEIPEEVEEDMDIE